MNLKESVMSFPQTSTSRNLQKLLPAQYKKLMWTTPSQYDAHKTGGYDVILLNITMEISDENGYMML